jgi:UPF0176 protein
MGNNESLAKFQIKHLALCRRLNLKGRVLIAYEGINGNLTGEEKNIEQYKKELHKDSRFSDIEFKEGPTSNHNFRKMFVRIRKEIVTSGFDIDTSKKGKYVEPEELKKWYDDKEDFVIVDARNDYEYKIGRFKNAVNLKLDTFKDFPKAVKQLSKFKNKKIVTYCTGGVRCEKASAYLRLKGFKDVHQLHGGIIKYGENVGDKHWLGKCFVFDTRGAIPLDPKKQSQPITQCTLCNTPCDKYHNCSNAKCDARFIACEKCFKILNECCSKMCRNGLKVHPEWHNPNANIGINSE